MGVEPRWKGLSVQIPVGMVSKYTYSALFAEAAIGGQPSVSFSMHPNVTGAGWDYLEQLYEVFSIYFLSFFTVVVLYLYIII